MGTQSSVGIDQFLYIASERFRPFIGAFDYISNRALNPLEM
jgi:hypothetical protein